MFVEKGIFREKLTKTLKYQGGRMFFHQLAGCLIFYINSLVLDQKPSAGLLILGALIATLPDLLYIFQVIRNIIKERSFKTNKNNHKHRDGFCHTLYFPFTYMLLYFVNQDYLISVFLSAMTHPLLDLWGIGWGVKLFYPLSKKTYKLFYKGKFLTIFSPEELEKEVEKFGEEQWWKKVYITFNAKDVPSWYGKLDWIALFCFCMIFLSVVF